MNCPHCGKEIETLTVTRSEIGKLMRSIPSEARRRASRENGKKGGRPRKVRKERER